MLFGFSAHAAMGPTYTHWETAGQTMTVPARDMYRPIASYGASDWGLDEPIKGITDIFCTEEGMTYLLCGEKSKLYLLNKDYSFNKEILVKDAEGAEVDYTDAYGVYVEGETIYLCDAANERILLLGNDGIVTDEITIPESDVIPADFVFQPTELARDADNNLYVLSTGSYYGALVFDDQLNFTGFYGANVVESSVLDLLGFLWNKLTMTDTKRDRQMRKLPYAFVSMTSDSDGFIYTTTATDAGQIKMLSPSGANILKSHGNDGVAVDSNSFNFNESTVVTNFKKTMTQRMSVVDVNENGYIYALEELYGLIYIYDNECNLLCAFGGGVEQGDELGMFTAATGMCLNGNQIVVGDQKTNRITVFEMTEYGALVQKVNNMYLDGDYAAAMPLWEQVLAMDSNSRLAYRGLAKGYYAVGEYEKSMEYAESAYDYVTYDQAYRQVRNKMIADNFVWIFVGLVALVAIIIVFLIYMKKRQTSLFSNIKVRTLMNTFVHPFQTFTDIKYKGYGSLPAAIVIIALFAFTSTLKITGSSFLYRTVDVYNYNSLFTLATTGGLLVLWIVANWLACTLMEGKGRMDEIAIVTAYSMIPMIAFNLLYTVLSYALSYEDAAILNGLATVMTIFTAYLLIVAIMTVHEYTFGKFVLSTVITIFFMILVVFVIFMMVILLQQLFNFINALYTEVAYR